MADEIDIALKSFEQTRIEIVERLKARETALLTHVTATITLGGVYFGFAARTADEQLDAAFLVPLSLLFPILSVAFAQIIAQHMIAIEHLASFIRTELAGKLKNVPVWDVHTKSQGKDGEIQKTSAAFLKHLMVLHGPTIGLTFCAAVAIATRFPEVLAFRLCFLAGERGQRRRLGNRSCIVSNTSVPASLHACQDSLAGARRWPSIKYRNIVGGTRCLVVLAWERGRVYPVHCCDYNHLWQLRAAATQHPRCI